jgi:hypothetical protein
VPSFFFPSQNFLVFQPILFVPPSFFYFFNGLFLVFKLDYRPPLPWVGCQKVKCQTVSPVPGRSLFKK